MAVQTAQTSAAASASPLSVVFVERDLDGSSVTFMVQNTGVKHVTAWHMKITVGRDSNGTGVDAYRSFAGLGPEISDPARAGDPRYILSGGTIRVTAPLPSGSNASTDAVLITPTCAVFDDRSFIGDSAFAAYVFGVRKRDAATWQTISNALNKAVANGPVSVETLKRAVSILEAIPQDNQSAAFRQSARTNLLLAIAAIPKSGSSAESELNRFLDEARRSLAAAVSAGGS